MNHRTILVSLTLSNNQTFSVYYISLYFLILVLFGLPCVFIEVTGYFEKSFFYFIKLQTFFGTFVEKTPVVGYQMFAPILRSKLMFLKMVLGLLPFKKNWLSFVNKKLTFTNKIS